MPTTRERVIYHKLPYFPLNLGKNLGKTWESIFSQVPFETSLQRKMKKNQERIGGEDDKEIQDQAHGR